jgi:HK97 family phage prohead protease/HK97 family phage major capsid protein
MPDEKLLTFRGEAPRVEVRSESAREIAIRFMRWNTVGQTAEGRETFAPGAFDGVRAENVILRMEHEGPPAGRGVMLERTDEGQVGVFKVAPTARGDELLTLAKEGYYTGASPSFQPLEGGTRTEGRGSERLTVRTKVDLREVSLTWRPTYEGTGVIYARTQEETKVPESTNTTQIEPSAVVPVEQRLSSLEQRAMGQKETEARNERLEKRITQLEERAAIPTGAKVPAIETAAPYRGDWMQAALTLMGGGSLTQLQERALADLIVTGNEGVVPPAYSKSVIGKISASRPFMENTTKIDMPANGMQIIFPRIATRPTVGVQAAQKTEVTSTAVTTDTLTANVTTYAGAGDISLQLLRRSDPSFLALYLDLLAAAYATTTDLAAVAALIAASPTKGGIFTVGTGVIPLGAAWTASVTAMKIPPDTMWVSSQAAALMIDANDTTGRPLYNVNTAFANVGANANANSTSFGSFKGLKLVWCPALDALTYDADSVTVGVQAARVLVGPSSGFAWAEDGTFTLQADVPGKLGRDVALAGFCAFVPAYPAAFTAYSIA